MSQKVIGIALSFSAHAQ